MNEYNIYKKTLLENIKQDLNVNYDEKDYRILDDLLDDTITNAFLISNRKENLNNLKVLSTEIKECVKTMYLQRGTEDVKSSGESGRSSVFKDPLEQLRNNIIKNGKRVLF